MNSRNSFNNFQIENTSICLNSVSEENNFGQNKTKLNENDFRVRSFISLSDVFVELIMRARGYGLIGIGEELKISRK